MVEVQDSMWRPVPARSARKRSQVRSQEGSRGPPEVWAIWSGWKASRRRVPPGATQEAARRWNAVRDSGGKWAKMRATQEKEGREGVKAKASATEARGATPAAAARVTSRSMATVLPSKASTSQPAWAAAMALRPSPSQGSSSVPGGRVARVVAKKALGAWP